MSWRDAWAHVPKARLVGFLLIAGFLVGSPVYRHVLGGKSPYLRGWMMYSNFALGNYCQVAYYERTVEGDQRVDRLELLGQTSVASAPVGLRRIGGEKDARAQAQALCRKLGPDADVRADLRCSSTRGWHRAMRREENLCKGRRR